MIDTKRVGTIIRLFRKNMNYTQDRLAELLRISPQAVSKWENGHTLPDTYLLPALARIFDCSIDQIIMPAVAFDSDAQGNIQAERIAARVVERIKSKEENALGFDDTTISEAIIKRHNITGYVTITRGKTSRAEGLIKTSITVSAPHNDIELTELVYHKRDNEFRGYALLSDYVSELPFVYYIDHSKKALLLESTDITYFKGYDFNRPTENGEQIRRSYNSIMRSVAGLHGACWENRSAFGRVGLPWHFEEKENMLAWIKDAMEKPYKKYKTDEAAGKIPKRWDEVPEAGENNISEKQMGYYVIALEYLKNEYPKLIDNRFHTGKNITVIHGDCHPGQLLFPKDETKSIMFSSLQNVRMGLGTEDLAMLIALHIEPDINKAKPILDCYYSFLSEKASDYPHENFINDYKLSIAENLFFPVRLINRGIYDFNMRDNAIKAFEMFVLDDASK